MNSATKAAGAFALLTASAAQKAGTQKPEKHPALQAYSCDTSGCLLDPGMITIDANWRWSHDASTPDSYENCFSGEWDPQFCPDAKTCVQGCAVEGEDEAGYLSQYGVSTSGDSVDLKFLTVHEYGTNVGSRVFMMKGDSYKIYKLKNREFTFTVDTSTLDCGINGALYFVEMSESGDLGKGGNEAGAQFGTGYCDAQCAMDLKWLDGTANVPLGSQGYCCAEIDVWEANSVSASMSMHICSKEAQSSCTGAECGARDRHEGICDRDGCDLNTYRNGDADFFGPGPGFKIDSSKPFTVTTQFITSDGTDAGELVEVKRFYTQNEVVVENSVSANLPPPADGGAGFSSITQEYCATEKKTFNDPDVFASIGGFKNLGSAMDRGMVLVMSIWDDTSYSMDWLDSTYPTGRNQVGDGRGDCPPGSGDPEIVRERSPNAHVTFSNLKFGAIGTTQVGVPGNVNTPGATASPTSAGPAATPSVVAGELLAAPTAGPAEPLFVVTPPLVLAAPTPAPVSTFGIITAEIPGVSYPDASSAPIVVLPVAGSQISRAETSPTLKAALAKKGALASQPAMLSATAAAACALFVAAVVVRRALSRPAVGAGVQEERLVASSLEEQ